MQVAKRLRMRGAGAEEGASRETASSTAGTCLACRECCNAGVLLLGRHVISFTGMKGF